MRYLLFPVAVLTLTSLASAQPLEGPDPGGRFFPPIARVRVSVSERSRRARVALAGSIARVSHFTRRRRTFTRFRGRIAAGRARALLNVVGTLSTSVSTLKSIVTVVSRPSHRVERARFKPYLGSRPSRSSSSSSRLRAHVPSAQRVRLVTARTKRTSTLSFLTHGFLSRSRRRASV